MDGTTRRTGRCVAATSLLTAGLAAVGAVALAAPTPGVWTSTGEGGAFFTVRSGAIRPAGTRPRRFITAPSTFKCNSSNLVVKTKRIGIRHGRFRYDGAAYVDRFRAPSRLGHLVWTGRFTSRSRVRGTYRFTSRVTPKATIGGLRFVKKRCDSGRHRWTGKPGFGG